MGLWVLVFVGFGFRGFVSGVWVVGWWYRLGGIVFWRFAMGGWVGLVDLDVSGLV